MNQDETTATRLAIVDISHFFRAKWHASADREVSWAASETVALVNGVAEKYDFVALCFDKGPYWRTKLFGAYKANREQADLSMREQYERLVERFSRLGYATFIKQGYEADDLIATLVERLRGRVDEIHVYTRDKDLLQLVNDEDGVKVVSTDSFDELDEQAVVDKMGVHPVQLRQFLALCGDKSDNIPGISLVGPKTAATLLNEHGTIEGIYRAISEGTFVGGEKVKTNLLRDKDNLSISLPLVELAREVEVDVEALFQPRKVSAEPEEEPEAPAEEAPAHVEEPIQQRGSSIVHVRSQETQLARPAEQNHGSIMLRPGVYLSRETLGLMSKLATTFDESRLYSKSFSGREQILSIMELGAEIGISPQVAVMSFHIVEGRPCPSAHLFISLAKRDPDCLLFECVKTTEEYAVYITRKKSMPDRELEFEYTIQDAEKAGMLKPSKTGRPTPWQQRPKEMLRKTAGSQAARLWYPGACLGMYSVAEMGGEDFDE